MPTFECSQCNEMTYSAYPGAVDRCGRCGSERRRVVEGDFDEARRKQRVLGAGDHAVLVSDDWAHAAPFCARFLAEGVSRGERVIAAIPAELRQSVAAELPDGVESGVEWDDPSAVYGDFDPDRIVSTYEGLLLEEPRPTRIVAGLDRASADDVDPDGFARLEAAAHAAIIRLAANVLCVYDAGSLPPELIDVALRRHGLVVEDGAVVRNERFEYEPV